MYCLIWYSRKRNYLENISLIIRMVTFQTFSWSKTTEHNLSHLNTILKMYSLSFFWSNSFINKVSLINYNGFRDLLSRSFGLLSHRYIRQPTRHMWVEADIPSPKKSILFQTIFFSNWLFSLFVCLWIVYFNWFHKSNVRQLTTNLIIRINK